MSRHIGWSFGATRNEGLGPNSIGSAPSVRRAPTTSGAFRKMMTTVSPDMFPGDPVRAAAARFLSHGHRAAHALFSGSISCQRDSVMPMDGIASQPVNGYYASSKFALE